MAPRPVANEPVRTGTTAGAVGGVGIATSIVQALGDVDWSSGVEAFKAAGPGVGGVALGLIAAIKGRQNAYKAETVSDIETKLRAEAAIREERGHRAGMAGMTIETLNADSP